MEEYEVDLRDYIRVIWRGKWIILIVFAMAVGTAFGLSLRLPRQYATQTMLLITPRVAEVIVEGQPPIVGTLSPEIYRHLATASDLLSEIIAALDLRNNPESLGAMMTPRVETGDAQAGFRSPLLTMTVRGSEPQELRAIANKWAELFIERNSRLLATATAQSYDFISQMFAETDRRLREKERERKEHQQQNPVETLQSEIAVLTSGYESFLTELHSKRLALVTTSAELQKIEQALIDEPRFLELQRSISNEALWNLLGTGISPRELHALPDLTVTDQQLNSIYLSLRGQWNRTRIAAGSLQSAVVYLEGKTTEFREQLDERTGKLAAVQLTLAQIDRDIRTLESTFTTLAGRLQETRIAAEEEATSIRIVESAIAPEVPIGPNKMMNITVAGVLGLFAGVLIAFFKHYMSGKTEEPKKLAHGE